MCSRRRVRSGEIRATIRDTFPLQGLTSIITQLAVASGLAVAAVRHRAAARRSTCTASWTASRSTRPLRRRFPFMLAGPTLKLNVAAAPVPLGATYVQPSAAADLAAAVNPSASGSIPGLAGNEIMVAGHRVPVADLRGLGLGLAALALLVLLTWPMRRRQDLWTPEQHLAARQGCVIVDIVALDDVASADGAARLREPCSVRAVSRAAHPPRPADGCLRDRGRRAPVCVSAGLGRSRSPRSRSRRRGRPAARASACAGSESGSSSSSSPGRRQLHRGERRPAHERRRQPPTPRR